MPSSGPTQAAMGENEATSTCCSNTTITRTTRAVLQRRDAHVERSVGAGQEVLCESLDTRTFLTLSDVKNLPNTLVNNFKPVISVGIVNQFKL
jgi:hypothetical protein